MKIYKCDACKKVLDKENKNEWSAGIVTNLYPNDYDYYDKNKEYKKNIDKYELDLDLCKDCFKDIIKVLKEWVE